MTDPPCTFTDDVCAAGAADVALAVFDPLTADVEDAVLLDDETVVLEPHAASRLIAPLMLSPMSTVLRENLVDSFIIILAFLGSSVSYVTQ
jgi:hypothetical protein